MKRNTDIKYLVMDVDGTLTDGKIYMGVAGEVMKAFDIKDGYGIHDIAPSHGIEPVIITGRNSEIVQNRCRELKIDKVYQGVTDKAKQLCSIVSNLSEVAYIGDDLNDIQVMQMVRKGGGLTGCPQDAVKEVRAVVDYVAECDGGHGAVRNFIDWITAR